METYNLRESLIHTKDPFESLYLPFLDWEFDYEINNLPNDILSGQNQNQNQINSTDTALKNKANSVLNNFNNINTINLNEFNDEFAEPLYKCEEISCLKLNFIKKLVSKKKVRLVNKDFDLDLIYITKRVMAMGFPARKCESLIRNNINDVRRLFRVYHNNNIKVFNLCLEKDRIYNKNKFPDNQVAIFPFSDHCPCPIR